MPAGVLCGLVALSQTGTVDLLDLGCGCTAAMLASTLPDCDIYEERLGTAVSDVVKMTVFSILYLFIKGGRFNPIVIPIFAALMWWGIKGKHRGRTHSLVATIIYSACFYAFIPNQRYMICFAVAYLSHLALDLLNKRGERLLWPFSSKGYALKVCKADSFLGTAIGVGCSIASVAFAIFLLAQNYLNYLF